MPAVDGRGEGRGEFCKPVAVPGPETPEAAVPGRDRAADRGVAALLAREFLVSVVLALGPTSLPTLDSPLLGCLEAAGPTSVVSGLLAGAELKAEPGAEPKAEPKAEPGAEPKAEPGAEP